MVFGWAILLLLLLTTCLGGCAYLRGYGDMMTDKGLSQDYRRSLETWSRSQTVYSQFETKVTIHATYRSGAFQEAHLREYSRIYQLNEEDQAARASLQKAFAADFTEFFFYAYLPNRDDNHFTGRNPLWTIYLLDGDGNRHEPLEVRRVEKVTALEETFFPYVKPYYGNCYSLRFPSLAEKKGRHLKLVFAGVPGRVELEWQPGR